VRHIETERGTLPRLSRRTAVIGAVIGAVALASRPVSAEEATPTMSDPLPSWNDGPAKRAILDFVAAVTDDEGGQFVPPADRIATFDNDGTLWVEQPIYSQALFALDEIARMAPEHPEWTDEEPFATVLSGDMETMRQLSEHAAAAILAASHAGMTTDAFDAAAADWLATARHPHFDRLYTDCVYQPQLELLDFLRANDFQIFIVSGGGIDFLRVFAEETYDIPPSQVIGSSGQVSFSLVDGVPTLTKEAKIGSIDDKVGKPVNIHLHIGQRPILAFGNSDGDLQMLQYTDTGDGARLMLLLHHDDAEREFAYDRDSHVGALGQAWDEAVAKGWSVVSMKNDWSRVFPWN
jgi:hypothetical protein